MNLTAALTIDGFMHPPELAWLAQQASTRKRVVEIGSWMGRSTRAIADNLPEGGVVYAVDTWQGTPGDAHYKGLQDKPVGWLLEQFRRNIGPELLAPPEYRVRPLTLPSVAAADYLGAGCYNLRFDMIFIDAAHDYDSVKADILAWRPLLAPGGLLCGHDYEACRTGMRAIDELIQRPTRGPGVLWYEATQ